MMRVGAKWSMHGTVTKIPPVQETPLKKHIIGLNFKLAYEDTSDQFSAMASFEKPLAVLAQALSHKCPITTNSPSSPEFSANC